ncbi:MAG: flippase [Veillonella sp.]|nr:flippase [Veillonella sp.]
MFARLLEKVKGQGHGSLAENIFSLVTIRGLEYVLAFLVFPYLVRVLGVDLYGTLVFYQSIIQYFILVVDFGFNLSGPKDIAKHDSLGERGLYFADIFWSKVLLLGGASLVCLCMLAYMVYVGNPYIWLFLAIYIGVVGNVLFPVWFFQGIQQMRYITMANGLARLVSVIGIFTLVKGPSDYVLAGLFQALPPVIAGCISFGILWRYYPETLQLSSWSRIKKTLKDSFHLFLSTVAMNLYTATTTVVLGLLTNATVVGYYSAAYKIIGCVQMVMAPISQAIYPHISKMVESSKNCTLVFLKKVTLILGGGNLVLSILLLVGAEPIVHLFLGSGYEESVLMLRIMSVLPFIISLSNILGIQTMLPFGLQKQFSQIIMISAVLNFIVVIPLIYVWSGLGACVTMVMIESFVTLAMAWSVKKNILGNRI